MKQKIFTLLVAFLTMVGNAVWGQQGDGTQGNPYIIDLNNPQDIGEEEGNTDAWINANRNIYSIVDWHGNNEHYPNAFVGWQANHDNLIEIKQAGYYKFTGNGSVTTDRIRINCSGEVHLTVSNVNIETTGGDKTAEYGRTIALTNNVTLNLTLENNNKLTSNGAAAIFVPEGTTLNITKQSTGTLDAKGYMGIGTAEDSSGALGKCGTINFNGGTIQISTSGDGGFAVGGTNAEGNYPFTIDGNTFVVLMGGMPDQGESITYQPKKGIVYIQSRDNTATVYGNVTLNSAFPDNESFNLTIDEKATLTLGAGIKFPTRRLVNPTENEKRLKAYKIQWKPNSADADDNPVHEVEDTYYGPNIEVTKEAEYTCDNHLQVGWLVDESNEAKTSYSTNNSTPISGVETHTVGAVWIDKKRTIQGNTETALTGSPKLRVYPNSVTNVTFTKGELPDGITYEDGVFAGTATETGTTSSLFAVNVGEQPIGEKAGTTVTFNIVQNKERVIDPDNSQNQAHGEFTYNGTVDLSTIKENYLNVYTTDGENLNAPFFEIESFTYTPEGGSAQTGQTEMKDAGTYSDFILKPAEGMNITIEGENENFTLRNGKITIKPATLTVTPNTLKSIDEGDELPELTFKTSGTVGKEKAAFEEGTELKLQAASLEKENSYIDDSSTPGTYQVVLGTLELEDATDESGFLAKNYTLKLNDKPVTLIIKDDIKDGNSGSIQVSVEGDDNLVYKGSNYNLEDYVTVEGLEKGTYNLQVYTTESNKQALFRNAGTYKVMIVGDYDHTVGTYDSKRTLTIKKKPLESIKAADQSIQIGGTPVLDASKHTSQSPLIEIKELIKGETPTFSGTLTLAETANVNVAGEYEEAISVPSNLDIKGNDSFRKENYSGWDELLKKAGKGKLTVMDDSGIDIEIPQGEGDITIDDNGNYSFPYDGKSHKDFFDQATVTITGEEGTPITLVKDKDFTIQYAMTDNEEFNEEEIWEAGSYTATFSITKEEYKGKSTIKQITVKPRTLTVQIKEQSISENGSITTDVIPSETVDVKNVVKGETVVFAEGSSLQNTQSEVKAGTLYKGVIKAGETFELGDGTDDNSFKAKNYDLSENIIAGNLRVKQSTDGGSEEKPIDPTDPDDENNDEPIVKPGDQDGWTWDPNAKGFSLTYDGETHPINNLEVKFTDSESGEVSYETVTPESVTYNQDTEVPKNAGDYVAAITLPKDAPIAVSGDKQVIYLKLIINKRDMTLDLHLPTSKDEVSNWSAAQAFDYGNLVKEGTDEEETPSLLEGIELVLNGNTVQLKGKPFITDNKESGFMMANYTASYLNNGESIDLKDEDGDGAIDLPDELFPDGGGNITYDYNNLHLIKSEGASLSSRHNKMRVKDGGSFTISMTLNEGYEDCQPTVFVKRGRYGNWEVLDIDEVSGYYQIRNVQSDIWVKVSGDGIWAVANEDINAQETRAYTLDNKIVVVTPQPEEVYIISMTGAVVANEQVNGQREFTNLPEGVYIVRIGEETFKLNVH